MSDDREIGIACMQFCPAFGRRDENLQAVLESMREARSKSADLVVLPELSNTGYAFESRDEVARLAEPMSDGATVTAWRQAALELNLHVVGGIAERAGDRLFNTAVLVSPDGTVRRYRKTHLSDREKDLFDVPDNGFKVHDTEIGRIAILICYDIWFPEALRACALHGAEIVCVPTNWSDLRDPQQERYPMAIYLLMAGAHCNGVFIACANRIGQERGIEFNGQSVIMDKSGWLIGSPLSKHENGLKVERCDLSRARDKYVSDRNSVIGDRRTDLYEWAMTEGGME